MKDLPLPVLTACAAIALLAAPLPAQDAAAPTCPYKSWVSSPEDVEQSLAEAEIVSRDDIGMGVTKPSRVELRDGGGDFAAAFKPIRRGRQGGFWESYQAEIAAYRLDRLLGLEMTPPTVERRIDKTKGSLQFWVADCKLYRDVADSAPRTADWSHQLSRMKMFDVLINNEDRNAQNFLVDPDDHVILIDHSRAFISGKRLLKNPKKLPSQFDRRLVEVLRALDRETLETHLKPFLSGGQIKGILERRDFLLEHLDALLLTYGAENVLF